MLTSISESEPVYNMSELRTFLASLVGFLILDKEIGKTFKEYNEMEYLLIEAYKKIEK